MFDDNKHVKLTDFSSSRLIFKQDDSNYVKDSLHYMAPETILNDKPYYTSDWWSLGIIFYQMIFGSLPFPECSILETFDKILKTDIVIPQHYRSDEAADLLSKLLQKDPK